jgi:hypothetical protein
MSTRIAGAAALAACALVLSACSESGTPVPGGNTGATTTTEPGPPPNTTSAANPGNRFGAPEVQNPLDATKQLANPCASLTESQLGVLGLAGPAIPGDEASFEDLGPYCAWRDTSGSARFTIGYIVPNASGLADLYRGQDDGQWAYWEPTTVNGYPGVWQSATDQRKRGHCTISVGISEELHFSVTSRGGEPDTACDQVKDVASAVVDTLKSGG